MYIARTKENPLHKIRYEMNAKRNNSQSLEIKRPMYVH